MVNKGGIINGPATALNFTQAEGYKTIFCFAFSHIFGYAYRWSKETQSNSMLLRLPNLLSNYFEIMSNYLGSNLKHLRKQYAINQSEVASVLNKAATTIGNWENGISEPNILELNKLATYFSVSIDDLINSNLGDSNDDLNDTKKHQLNEPAPSYEKVPTKKMHLTDKDAVIQAQQITIETLQKALALAEAQILLLKNSPF